MEAIKILRDRTGAGMVDCKKALDEAGGEVEAAVDILRKKGIAKAAKRAERVAGQGIIKVWVNDEHTRGCLVELNAETDFVTRNSDFQTFADKVLMILATETPVDEAALLSLPLGDSTVGEGLLHLSGVIGEKLSLGRFAVLTGATVGVYSHANGQIGVLVSLDQSGQSELAREAAMHIAASQPRYLTPSDVPAEEMEKEKAVYREQLTRENKPEDMLKKIVEGKLNKYYSEVCLVKQEYFKDDKQTVEQILGNVHVVSFVRYSL